MKKFLTLCFALLLSAVASIPVSAQKTVLYKFVSFDRSSDLRYYVGKKFSQMEREQKITSRFWNMSHISPSDIVVAFPEDMPREVFHQLNRASSLRILHDDSGNDYHWMIFSDASGTIIAAEPFHYRWWPFNPAEVEQYDAFEKESEKESGTLDVPKPYSLAHEWNEWDFLMDYGKTYGKTGGVITPSDIDLGKITITPMVR